MPDSLVVLILTGWACAFRVIRLVVLLEDVGGGAGECVGFRGVVAGEPDERGSRGWHVADWARRYAGVRVVIEEGWDG